MMPAHTWFLAPARIRPFLHISFLAKTRVIRGKHEVQSRILRHLVILLHRAATVEIERLIFSEENKAEHLLFSVERGRYKLIRRLKPEPGTELYDLQSDPGETRNIAADHPELVGRMTEAGEAIRSRRSVERDEVALDQATREELRALGYVE